ncbi:hypothetical protein DFH06DRAFT_64208 [Mycena polygramma]|nr:hypothetical protein DFH06DRAFT_64208 [Mycena polygramma]
METDSLTREASEWQMRTAGQTMEEPSGDLHLMIMNRADTVRREVYRWRMHAGVPGVSISSRPLDSASIISEYYAVSPTGSSCEAATRCHNLGASIHEGAVDQIGTNGAQTTSGEADILPVYCPEDEPSTQTSEKLGVPQDDDNTHVHFGVAPSSHIGHREWAASLPAWSPNIDLKDQSDWILGRPTTGSTRPQQPILPDKGGMLKRKQRIHRPSVRRD